jgi:tetratricopeptide (TPR) repeat protein
MVLALLASGRPNEAITHLNKLLQQNKDSAEIHYKLALAFSMQNKHNEAIQHFAKVLDLDPNYPEVHNKMGLALMSTGNIDEAVSHLEEALRTSKDKAEVYANLGIAYSLLGKYDLTIQNWSKAAELKPNDAGVLNNLAWILATVSDTTLQDADRAIALAEHACEMTGHKQPNLLDTLAASYAAGGRFEEAVKTAQKAIDAAKGQGQEELAGKIEKRKELYQTGKPYIQE